MVSSEQQRDSAIHMHVSILPQGFSSGSDGKKICLQCGRPGFDLWLGKIPWRREQLPTPVFWPGDFHGQRSLVGYSSWGHKKLDMPEQLFVE